MLLWLPEWTVTGGGVRGKEGSRVRAGPGHPVVTELPSLANPRYQRMIWTVSKVALPVTMTHRELSPGPGHPSRVLAGPRHQRRSQKLQGRYSQVQRLRSKRTGTVMLLWSPFSRQDTICQKMSTSHGKNSVSSKQHFLVV